MKRILMGFFSRHVFAGVFLALVLHATAIAPGNTIRAAAVPAKPNNSLIRIWIVGSPHKNDLPPAVVPPELRQRAESLGYTIQIEAFRPDGFATHFHTALLNRTEPEILTFDNYGVITGIKTVMGQFQGIDWDRKTASSLALVHETMNSLQPVGWVMLVRSAANYEAARTLSLRPPECDAKLGRAINSSNIEPALREAREIAMSAARAYIDCDQSALAGVSDEARMVRQCFQPQSVTKVESVKACSVSGNDRFAVVSLVGGFSAVVRDKSALVPSKPGMDLGQRSLIAVMRNQSGTWRLLAITHDPWITHGRSPMPTNTLANSLDKGPVTGITPEPARLLTPNGVYPVPQNGQRFGDFIWEPSTSHDVIGQVAEFSWGPDTNWNMTRLFFLPASATKLSAGSLPVGGTTKWRVWSISRFGEVVFSEQYSFKHCPCPTICGAFP